MEQKYLAGILIVVFAAFLLGAYVFFIAPPPKSASAPLKVSMNAWTGFFPAFIAQEKGFFKKNGVDVQLTLKENTADVLALYESGAVDGAYTVYPDAILGNLKGIKQIVVYVVDYSNTADVIIGDPTLNSLADLRGKTVGIDGVNTFSHLFVLQSLEKAGLHEGDFLLQNVPASQVLAQLESKNISAGHTYDPFRAEAVSKGYKTLGTAGDVRGIITDVLVFSPEAVKSRPKDVQAYIKSISEATDFLRANPQEAIGIISRDTNISVQDIQAGFGGITMPNLEENAASMEPSDDLNSLYGSGNVISQFYMTSGQISKVPDFKTIVYPAFVQNILSESKK